MNHTKTLKLRIKDKHAKTLLAMAREVNMVWNYCNETSCRAIQDRRQWLSGYDLQRLTNGLSKCEGILIGSATQQQVCEDYATCRKQAKRSRLSWRVSDKENSKYSLGWIPSKAQAIRYKNGQIYFAGFRFDLWDSYGLSQYALRSGSFTEDSRGRWYLNICVQVESKPCRGTAAIGIDLGLKTSATTSDGGVLVGREYRKLEQKLGTAQRAGKKARVRALHARIKNRRKDAQHKFSTALVERCAAIFVGDVASVKLVKTRMAKSTLDAGWGQLKTMLEQKCQRAGVVFEVVDERYTTQTCSCCGSISTSSPKGRAGLRIREWTCVCCGTAHDRDVNAARNILAAGHRRLAVGIPAL